MSITRFQGPLLVPGAAGSGTPPAADYNDTPGPSCFSHGTGLVDTRFGPYNGGDVTNAIPVWYGTSWVCVSDQAPATLETNNIAAAQAGSTGLVMVLAAASTGITVLAAPLTLAGGNVIPTGCLVIDGNPGTIQLAPQAGGISMYDPRTTSQRALTITSAGTDTSGTASIFGYDFYGFPMHQTITLGSSGSPVTTAKTFKFVQSITLAGTLSGSNVSVGTADVYGFALASYEFPFIQIYWNALLIAVATNWTAAVTTSPSTAALGDVRGTYAPVTASNGTRKLQVFVQPQAWNCTTVGLFGVPQF